MEIIHSIAEFRKWRQAAGFVRSSPFVPTMGALHEGHASLVRAAREMADGGAASGIVLASIFVNPTQFGPQEDFAKYPRTLEADAALLTAAGCDAVFVPSADEMYPGIAQLSTQHSALSTSIDPGPLANVLEGAIRPGHFRGVCTVVAKLLNIVQPSHLLLGQKDFQQQAILRQMCVDLDMPVEVVTCPTLREADGLAMSSRNRYLTAEERTRAPAIYRALTAAKGAWKKGETSGAALEATMAGHVTEGGLKVEYAEVCDARTLKRLEAVTLPAVLLIAARVGKTRLIDNMLL